jgi:hypothetical protein
MQRSDLFGAHGASTLADAPASHFADSVALHPGYDRFP